MHSDVVLFDSLAALLEYPREKHAARVRELTERVAADLPEARADLEKLARFAGASTLGEAEELYVRTFDANAERALEVGWQVFGEQYERGAFLVDLRGRMRDLGVAETTELPDHLTQVLRLLGRMNPGDARMLADRAVLRSLERVRGHLGEDDPYRGVIDAVGKALARLAAGETAAAAGGERA
jgi:nitrate reductase delta subunit